MRHPRGDFGREHGRSTRVYVQGRGACVAESSGKLSESCGKFAGELLPRKAPLLTFTNAELFCHSR